MIEHGECDDLYCPACQAILRIIHTLIVTGRFKKPSSLLGAELARRLANFRVEINAEVFLIAVTPSRATALVVPSDSKDLFVLVFEAKIYSRNEMLQ